LLLGQYLYRILTNSYMYMSNISVVTSDIMMTGLVLYLICTIQFTFSSLAVTCNDKIKNHSRGNSVRLIKFEVPAYECFPHEISTWHISIKLPAVLCFPRSRISTLYLFILNYSHSEIYKQLMKYAVPLRAIFRRIHNPAECLLNSFWPSVRVKELENGQTSMKLDIKFYKNLWTYSNFG
jgi:hypothetical protein